ncbi:hypothetical protein Asi03nite_44470 [Actinoplanes siamensis]|uniref:Uncharacterized protein n=1 Tax=Actinoplanes siamensis TaxID=1223317 RepID=A0A919TLX3_9ACTN|nr:hypothetical protein Asi03nite_44470 [Actinoplanes siamensis]
MVGSRAGGTANPASDWDYILSGPSRARGRAANSLRRGTGDGEGSGRGRDIFQDYNPNAPAYTTLDPNLPHDIFLSRRSRDERPIYDLESVEPGASPPPRWAGLARRLASG